MTSVLVVANSELPVTQPMSETAARAMFAENRVVTPAPEKIQIAASDYLMVSPAILGELRHHVVNHRTYGIVPKEVLKNPLLFKCVDLVSGASGKQEVFLRALANGIDASKKSNLSFKADAVHCIKLSLRSLKVIKDALADETYDMSGVPAQDVEKINEYFALIPDAVDIDMDSKKVVDTYEKDVPWRITMVEVTPATAAANGNPAVDEVVKFASGFSESTVNLKRHSCGERPATKVAKRAREEEEKDERLEQSEKIARLFKSVVDVPGARYFTFDGSYDMSKLMVVEDADGNQSLMIPFAK